MTNQIEVTRFFTTPARDLFNYFIEPALLEKWCYPEGMMLKVPKFEARDGGKYRYEHTSEKGTYLCEGHIERIVPNESIRSMDDWMKGPDGKLIGQNITCDINFRSLGDGCEVMVRQAGFTDESFARECEQGWSQCFDHLQKLTQSSKISDRPSTSDKSGPQIDQSR